MSKRDSEATKETNNLLRFLNSRRAAADFSKRNWTKERIREECCVKECTIEERRKHVNSIGAEWTKEALVELDNNEGWVQCILDRKPESYETYA